MKPTRFIPVATMAALCGFSLLGIAPKALSSTLVDTELAILVDASGSTAASNTLFGQIINAHSSLFQSASFFNTYVAPLPKQQIAVSLWIYAVGTFKAVDWTLINSQASATAFGTAVSGVTKTLPTTAANLGLAIQNASDPSFVGSINNNAYVGDYRIFDLASNGATLGSVPNPTVAATTALALPPGQKIDAINSISTTGTVPAALLAIKNLTGNNNNPVSQAAFNSLGSFTVGAANPYGTVLAAKLLSELVGTRTPPQPPTTTPEPSALLSLLGLSLIPLVNKRAKKSID